MLNNLFQPAFARGYAIASHAYRQWHGLLRKDLHGAQTAVWADGKILLVRNTYRNTFNLPGGYIASGEEAVTAAQRELREEVGIWCSRDQLKLAFVNAYAEGSVKGKDWIFETNLDLPPMLTLDLREIESAAFYTVASALELRLEGHVKRYLEAVPFNQHQTLRNASA